MPSEEHREFRSLVKYRKTLDWRINKTKCTIRAWFVNHGIAIDRGDKAWHTGRALINSFRKPLAECSANELWKGELDIELTQLDSLSQQMDVVVKKLEAIGKNDPHVYNCARFLASDHARLRSWWLASTIRIALRADAKCRPTSAWFHANSSPAKPIATGALQSAAIHSRHNSCRVRWASLRYNPWAKGVYERICGKQKTSDSKPKQSTTKTATTRRARKPVCAA